MIHGETVVEQSKIDKLAASLSGHVILPGALAYDQARALWNGSIDRRPGLFVRCQGVADVMRALEYAHQEALPVAVKAGGHNVAGNAICDDGLVIDLSLMKGVRVDPGRRTAQVQAGVLWREFDRESSNFGLATTGGTVSSTGVAGLTLGGGFGWIMGKYGLTCDNVLSFDVVTADGRFLTANAHQNEDLYWALRGGGGNFGVVTSFEFQLHPVTTVLAGLVLHPLSKTREILHFYRDYTASCPDEVEVYAVRMTAPDGNPAVAVVICYCGDLTEGEKVIAPWRTFSSPLVDMIAPVPFVQFQGAFDAGSPAGMHQYWKTNFLRELSDESLRIVEESFFQLDSPYSFVFLEHIHGAVSRVGKTETAFYHRDAQYNFTIMSTWTDPTEAAKQTEFARRFSKAMDPFTTGEYVNYLSRDSDDLIKGAFGKKYDRMVAVKTKYDPTNFFRFNQNIKPAGAR